MSEIIVRKEKNITTITLNRPRALNAINLTMVEDMLSALETAEKDDTKAVVIRGAGERGLSGGGDIKEMAADNAVNAHIFIEREYELDLKIAEFKKPVIALMQGITMGGGIGVSGHADVRVVTETSVLAMPESKIGIMPDVGGNLLLAKAPGKLGEYLALSADRMSAADAIAFGFADVFIKEADLERFLDELAARAQTQTEMTVPQAFEIAERFAKEVPAANLISQQGWIDEFFAEAAEGISELTKEQAEDGVALADWAWRSLQNIIRLAESGSAENQAALAVTLREMSPTSLAVSLAQVARTRVLGLNLAAVLADDLRILTKMFALPDFVEGVRALALDKDHDPKWSPASIEALEKENLAQILALN